MERVPDPINLEFYKNPPTPLTLRDIIWELVLELLTEWGIQVRRSYSKQEVTETSVVIELTSRRPGGKTGETYKPRLRAVTVSSDGDRVIEYYAQGFVCTYRFDVFSTSSTEVSRVADSLEDAIRMITPDLQRLGVDEFYFFNQDTATMLIERTGEQLYQIGLVYQAVVERVFPQPKPAVKLISVEAGAGLTLYKDAVLSRTRNGEIDLIADSSGVPYRNIVSVLFASDVPGIYDKVDLARLDVVPLEYGIYVPQVDFVPWRDESGRYYIIWIDNGRKPEPGKAYYLTFRALSEHVTTSDSMAGG